MNREASRSRLPAIGVAACLGLFWIVAAGARAQEGAAPRASAAQRQLAEAQAVLEELAALEEKWRTTAEADAQAAAARLEEVAALEAQLGEAEAGSEAAGAVFDRSKKLIREAAADLRAVIAGASVRSEIPGLRTRDRKRPEAFEASDPPVPATRSEADRLAELRQRCEVRTRELEALELTLSDESLARHGTHAGRLWLVRLDALEKLPAKRRENLFSLTRERWREVLFDFDVARLSTEWQWFRLRRVIDRLPVILRDFFAATEVGGALFRVVLVVLLWRWAQRRRPRVLERLQKRAARLGGRAYVIAELIAASATWGIFLLGLWGLHWALGDELRDLPFVGALLFVLAGIYGAYRLAADLIVAVLAAGAEHTAFEMSAERHERLDGSVRRVLRVALVIFLLPAFYKYRLEGGVLYELLREVGLWVVLVAGVVELAPWRVELTDAYLAMRSSGRWAGVLRRTRDRKVGIVLAPFSFLSLAGRGLWSLGHEVASGYEGTRLATTYLARRRIEKEAEERGYADVPLDRLPAGLSQALDEKVCAGDAEIFEEAPGLDDALRSVDEWRRGEGGGAFLLAGEQGGGKDAWLGGFCAHEPDATRLRLERRLLEPAELISWLGRSLLGDGEVPGGREELAERLGAGERRIVIVESAENLFLARVDGYRALAEMAAVAGATRLEVFWLLAMEGLAFNHLRATSKELTALGRVAVLPDWPAPRIRDLLRHRLASDGFEVSYAELLGELGSGEDSAAREREGEQAYVSLLADFAGGNPRVALHYFLRSLVPADGGPSGNELKVRPFRPPNEGGLAELDDEAHFLLAAVARHGSLTREEAAAVTAYRPALAGILLARLVDLGVLAAEGDRYRVATHWQSTVFRLLRRRNVLVS